jgi:hypothetical protein
VEAGDTTVIFNGFKRKVGMNFEVGSSRLILCMKKLGLSGFCNRLIFWPISRLIWLKFRATFRNKPATLQNKPAFWESERPLRMEALIGKNQQSSLLAHRSRLIHDLVHGEIQYVLILLIELLASNTITDELRVSTLCQLLKVSTERINQDIFRVSGLLKLLFDQLSNKNAKCRRYAVLIMNNINSGKLANQK